MITLPISDIVVPSFSVTVPQSSKESTSAMRGRQLLGEVRRGGRRDFLSRIDIWFLQGWIVRVRCLLRRRPRL